MKQKPKARSHVQLYFIQQKAHLCSRRHAGLDKYTQWTDHLVHEKVLIIEKR